MTDFALRPGRHRRAITAIGAIAACASVVGGLLLGSSALASRSADTGSPAATVAMTTPISPAPTTSGVASTPSPSFTAAPASGPVAYAMPVVPVAGFWTVPASVSLWDLSRLWTGSADSLTSHGSGAQTYTALAVPTSDVAGLTRYFGTAPSAAVRSLGVAEVKTAVRGSATTLGLLEADDVTPDVRALGLDGLQLFGSDRIDDPAAWRLRVATPTPPRILADATWTLAAGGDVNLDRRIYVAAVTDGLGPDNPWLGGSARIVGGDCCGMDGSELVTAKSRGNRSAVQDLFHNADLALVNFEGSAPNDYVYRPNSLVFTFDPALLVGLADTGIDMVSLANNHIRNGGDQGVLDTMANLDAVGVAHVGAGANLAAADTPGWLSAGGIKVAVLAYSAVGPGNWATNIRPGATPLQTDRVVADIRAVKAAGADVVIVMPHWGQEYSYMLSAAQKSQASAFVAAGADLVLGSHSHWVGGLQSLQGDNGTAFVDYSMGDLLFDLNHDAAAQEAEVVTLTFVGRTLAQVQLDPTVMIGGTQVGLLDPAGDGRTVMNAIRIASRGMLDW